MGPHYLVYEIGLLSPRLTLTTGSAALPPPLGLSPGAVLSEPLAPTPGSFPPQPLLSPQATHPPPDMHVRSLSFAPFTLSLLSQSSHRDRQFEDYPPAPERGHRRVRLFDRARCLQWGEETLHATPRPSRVPPRVPAGPEEPALPPPRGSPPSLALPPSSHFLAHLLVQ
jgi:hypothetical protein